MGSQGGVATPPAGTRKMASFILLTALYLG
jgi:hypothetical protein